MEIPVLICHTDGSQTLETRQVPEDYFDKTVQPEESPAAEK